MTLGARAYRELLAGETISPDIELQAAVREVGERIAAVAERPDYEWEFALIEADEASAFALPGGKVVVYTGLLRFARDSAGLAAVIGHEVAHALARHAAERLSQRRIIDALASGATGAIGLPGLGHLAVVALGLGVRIGYELPFSRAQELEADHIGLILMARAGYDSQQAFDWQGTRVALEGDELVIGRFWYQRIPLSAITAIVVTPYGWLQPFLLAEITWRTAHGPQALRILPFGRVSRLVNKLAAEPSLRCPIESGRWESLLGVLPFPGCIALAFTAFRTIPPVEHDVAVAFAGHLGLNFLLRWLLKVSRARVDPAPRS